MLVAQSCPILCDLMDYSPLSSSVHGILQVRVLEGVAISVSRGMNLGYSVLLRLNPSIAVQTLLLTMRTTPFLLRDSCPP